MVLTPCSIKKKKKKKKLADLPIPEEAVKFADYKAPEEEPQKEGEAHDDSRTPAEIAFERAQQKRVIIH